MLEIDPGIIFHRQNDLPRSRTFNVYGSEIRRRCGLPKVDVQLRERGRKSFGRAARMSQGRLPRKMLTVRLGARRPVGSSHESRRQVTSEDLKLIECNDNYPEVQNRDSWRFKSEGSFQQPPARRSGRRFTRCEKVK